MPIYELSCETGHRSESLQASTAPLPACPVCGAATRKLLSGFGVGGSASAPPPPERMPQTWKGTHRGDRDYVSHLRRVADARRDLEARHPELAGDSAPGPGAKDPEGSGEPQRGAPVEREGSGT